MDIDRLNQLLRGPLGHPLYPFMIQRLSLALWFVVERCGVPAEEALEEWCRQRQEQDELHGEG